MQTFRSAFPAFGLATLVASVVGGELWTRIGPSATFYYGAVFALLGSVALLVFVPVRFADPPALSNSGR